MATAQVGDFITIYGDSAIKNDSSKSWTLKALPNGFPRGHSFQISNQELDHLGRSWSDVTTSVPPELHSRWLIPISPHDSSSLREDESHPFIINLNSNGRQETPFLASHLRLNNSFRIPTERTMVIMWKDGTAVRMVPENFIRLQNFQELHQIISRSEEDYRWAVDKFKMVNVPAPVHPEVFYTES